MASINIMALAWHQLAANNINGVAYQIAQTAALMAKERAKSAWWRGLLPSTGKIVEE